ncbi:uracil-DNA glycosylase family protein [Aliikangiella marina]|uniref:Uracil-DNA glycosylase family protein n=1 Tax=Aliikangiella marina TaxID=1712262 RepID=A0A545T9U7_9GAMM|nr:uracil-DNA glycosylase family protein [Aliikangiella marina]TQV73986.1 uracil-DNA glycosylase family protein [Aliikangiella marina]
MQTELAKLLSEIKACRLCEEHLPLGANPVLRAAPSAKILIAGQAPGTAVHKTSIPFNDPSGERLRDWMGVSHAQFYDQSKIAIVPMGFCYPGRGKSGDLPPRPECSQTWHHRLFSLLPNVELILPIGQYAQAFYLGASRKKNLTETVRAWREYLPRYLPLPHPSPRNNIWLKRNDWFTASVLPYLRESIHKLV